ncbi:hypothetical protein TW86_14130 [Halomonas sp. S2151]|uniref:hypothetical protein n=1 Tax=Halomonas sp. S2151 TaxID=579478 RepID=UPI0005FA848C|nr:hypothetical protein [Halomonas sp. S2151]KJZ10431.1 hypothetical protein TW86_14130 [Halomonas sp. S2151]
MLQLFIHADAQNDLDELWAQDEDAAAHIEVMLEEIRGDERLLSTLLEHDFGSYREAGHKYSISKWLHFWNRGQDLWRLKAWELEESGTKLRIVYAYLPSSAAYHVLAIAPREFNYDPEHPITRRVLAAYNDLC